ncbi:MAG: hypothetical protein JNL74_19625 [Fibrobacteres bacterium]|nr:hypothetical protein [Fibrobacterota bacterium]
MVLLYRLLLFIVGIVLLPVWAILILFNIQWSRMRFAISEPSVIDSRKSIVIHGASLGEMAIVKKLIPIVHELYPKHPIIVSVTSPSGYKNITETMADSISHAVFLPVEFTWCVRRMLKFTNPELIIITETELWPNFLLEAKRQNIKLILTNGRMSDRTTPSYMRFKRMFAPVVQAFSKIGVQTEEYRKRFINLGAAPENVFVTGNLKEVLDIKNCTQEAVLSARAALGLPQNKRIFIAASTRPGEEAIILSALKLQIGQMSELILLIAPRHLDRIPEVEKIISETDLSFIKKSAITGTLSDDIKVILLDTHGELSKLYNAGFAAFVGGTLVDIGGHNLLEPLSAMLPVVFGPSVHQQKASADKLIRSGAGKMVHSAAELTDFILSTYCNNSLLEDKRGRISQLLSGSKTIKDANRDLISQRA